MAQKTNMRKLKGNKKIKAIQVNYYIFFAFKIIILKHYIYFNIKYFKKFIFKLYTIFF